MIHLIALACWCVDSKNQATEWTRAPGSLQPMAIVATRRKHKGHSPTITAEPGCADAPGRRSPPAIPCRPGRGIAASGLAPHTSDACRVRSAHQRSCTRALAPGLAVRRAHPTKRRRSVNLAFGGVQPYAAFPLSRARAGRAARRTAGSACAAGPGRPAACRPGAIRASSPNSSG